MQNRSAHWMKIDKSACTRQDYFFSNYIELIEEFIIIDHFRVKICGNGFREYILERWSVQCIIMVFLISGKPKMGILSIKRDYNSMWTDHSSIVTMFTFGRVLTNAWWIGKPNSWHNDLHDQIRKSQINKAYLQISGFEIFYPIINWFDLESFF